MDSGCLICGGTFTIEGGLPCPNCKRTVKMIPKFAAIPVQYQGVKFDSSFIPANMQKVFGPYMDKLMQEITVNIGIFQKNILICSRPNCGKTVWAYSLYATLNGNGTTTPPVMDIVEARNLLNSYDRNLAEDAKLLSTARCALIKLPKDMQFWMFDAMLYIMERRVMHNGFTIFLYSGTEHDIKSQDKFDKLRDMRGSGAFHTVEVKSFIS